MSCISNCGLWPFGGSQTIAISNIFNILPSTNFLLLGVILSPLRIYKLMNIKSNAWAMVNTWGMLSFIAIFIDCCNLQLRSGGTHCCVWWWWAKPCGTQPRAGQLIVVLGLNTQHLQKRGLNSPKETAPFFPQTSLETSVECKHAWISFLWSCPCFCIHRN